MGINKWSVVSDQLAVGSWQWAVNNIRFDQINSAAAARPSLLITDHRPLTTSLLLPHRPLAMISDN